LDSYVKDYEKDKSRLSFTQNKRLSIIITERLDFNSFGVGCSDL